MRYVCDAMLGRLARWLRLLGHDTLYADVGDEELLRLGETRRLLSRDIELARRGDVPVIEADELRAKRNEASKAIGKIKQGGGDAAEEIAHMATLCEDHDANTLLTVARELTEAGVREAFRVIEAQAAGLEQFAIHGSLDE